MSQTVFTFKDVYSIKNIVEVGKNRGSVSSNAQWGLKPYIDKCCCRQSVGLCAISYVLACRWVELRKMFVVMYRFSIQIEVLKESGKGFYSQLQLRLPANVKSFCVNIYSVNGLIVVVEKCGFHIILPNPFSVRKNSRKAKVLRQF